MVKGRYARLLHTKAFAEFKLAETFIVFKSALNTKETGILFISQLF